MIEKLNVFSAGTFVNCNDWNANFRTLNNYSEYCREAVDSASVTIAFPSEDLSMVFDSVRNYKNSSFVVNHIIPRVDRENEYFDSLIQSTEQLEINLQDGFNATARFIIKISNEYEKTTPPFVILSYNGEKHIEDDGLDKYDVGTYMLFLYESNGQCIIKITKTGV